MERPSRESLHLATARLWAKRSTCKRPNRAVGCIVTTADMQQILAFGYNGPLRGQPNDSCTNKPDCSCAHAEINALLKCDGRLEGKIMFVTLEPCFNCAKAIVQANIKLVYYMDDYRNHDGLELLRMCGVEVRQVACFPI